MKINKYFLLHNKKLKPWIKYWLYIKSKDKNYVLSDILQGTSFYLENSSNKKFNLFQINGNSIQNGTPTPTNPVEIKSVGSINEVISNKNWCNGINQNYFINTNATRAGVASDNSGLLIKTDGISSYTISTKVLQARYRVGVSKTIPTTVGGITLYNGQVKDGTNNSITINSNGYDYLIVNATDLTNIQIEKGSSATSFVAHQEQNISIPCQQPMRSIGNVRDEFIKQDGVWYEKHNIGQVVLNGSRDWVKSTYSNEKYFCGFLAYGISNSIVGSFTINDRFQIGYYVDVLDKECMSSMPQLHVRILASRLTENSVNAFKTWLSTHNTEVIYQLAEPIYLECTQEQVQVLESITQSHTYKHITNINSTDITPAFLKIQYYMEV